MFGGFGLYGGEKFFGIIHQDRLHFKTDAGSASVYREHGMECFQPNVKRKLASYYEVTRPVPGDMGRSYGNRFQFQRAKRTDRRRRGLFRFGIAPAFARAL